MSTVMEGKDLMTDMFRQATETFNQTMRTGMKFQEDTARFWTDTVGHNMNQMRTQAERMTEEAYPAAKKNLEQFHRMFDAQAQKSLDMLRQTFDGNQRLGTTEMFDQTMGMCRNSFDAMRNTVDMMTKANAELFENWSEMTRRATNMPCTKTNGKPHPAPAKA